MKKEKSGNLDRKYMIAGLFFLAPATIIYFIFAIIPFFDSFLLSFHDWNGFSAREFIGVENYLEAFQDRTFFTSIYNSVYLGVVSSVISVVVGVLTAWLMLYVLSLIHI